MSETQVAAKALISSTQISGYEVGRTVPEAPLLKILADLYQWPVDYFFMEHPPFETEGKRKLDEKTRRQAAGLEPKIPDGARE